MAWSKSGVLAIAPVLVLACAGPSATSGLLEGKLPVETMAQEGDLGFDNVNFATKQVLMASGLRIVLEQATTRGMAGVVVTVGAGSTSDPAGKEGLAHFAEHLAFRGRLAEGGQSLGQRLHRVGATYNAFTTLDATKYFFFAPRAQLPVLIAVAGELLTRPLADVDPPSVVVEHDIVINELRQRNETRIYGRVLGLVQAALFPADHPYARPIGGTPESLSSVTLADAVRFAAASYRPDNATMLVIGDMTSDEAVALLENLPRRLAGDPASPREPRPPPATRPPSQPPPPPPAGHSVHTAAISRPEAWIAWVLPSVYSRTGAQVKIVTAPVLEQRLRAAFGSLPDIVDISVIPIPSRQVTMLACQIVLFDAAKRDVITKVVMGVVAELWRPLTAVEAQVVAGRLAHEAYTITPTQTLRYREAVDPSLVLNASRETVLGMQQEALATVVFGAEAFSDRALDRADFLHALGDHTTYLGMLKAATRLSSTEVSQFAQRYLSPERARVLYIDPLPDRGPPPPGVVGLSPVDRQANRGRGAAIDFGAPPAAAALADLAAARTVRLENGLSVALVPRNQFPVVVAALAFHGGRAAAEPPGAVDLLRIVEPSGSVALPLSAMQVQSVDAPDYTADIVRGGRRNLGNALAMLAARLVRTDRLDWDEILEGAHAGPASPPRPEPIAQTAERALLQALYGSHVYGKLPKAGELAAIAANQIKSSALRLRHPRNATLVVVGDFDPGEAEKTVRAWYGGWRGYGPGSEVAIPPAPMPAAGKETLLVHHRPGVSQTEVVFGCRLPPFDARALTTHRVLASLVGDEIYTSVREEAGAAYSVEGEAVALRGGAAHMVLRMAVDDTRLRQVLAVVRAGWARLAAGEFDRGELSQVKWHLSTSAGLAFQTSTELALRAVATLNLGLPIEAVDGLRRDLATIDVSDLATAFRTCAGTTVISLVGDSARIRSAL